MELHTYPDYDTYKKIQIEANERKLDWVWAREENIRIASEKLFDWITPKFGICHGTRRGEEQAWFKKYLNCQVIGTEISPTATQFSNTVEWDFHEIKPEWVGACDFIYSNALDHAYDPSKALSAWRDCLKDCGVLVLEWGGGHNKNSHIDPFAATVDEYISILKNVFGVDDAAFIQKKTRIKDRVLLFCLSPTLSRRNK